MIYTIEHNTIDANGNVRYGYVVCVHHQPVGEIGPSLPDITFTTVTQASEWARQHFSQLARLEKETRQ